MPEETFSLEDLASAFAALAQTQPASVGIGVTDAEVGRYARVMEYGSVAGSEPWPRPGPRTTLGVNPDTGEQVVVSIQAPQGFIRRNTAAMSEALAEQLREPADWFDAESLTRGLDEAVHRAAGQSVDLLRSAAPRDSGRLAESLQIIDAE